MRYLTASLLDPATTVRMQSVTLQLSGVILLLLFVALGTYIGWSRGIRAVLTVALVSVIAYLICVEGGQLLVGVVNRFYQNGPRLAAFAVGRDPATAPVLDPLISPSFTIPLFFRFVLFIVLVAFGWFFRRRAIWYRPQPEKNEPFSAALGGFVGAFIAILWTAAAIAFWVELVNSGGGFDGFLADILFALPDITPFMPALITIFFLLLFVIILFSLPKLAMTKVDPKK